MMVKNRIAANNANSPQAKGRIERLFDTLQDRLIKEMRLKDIKSKEEANRFLKEYLSIYNKRFSVSPKNETNLHREIPKEVDLDGPFSIKTERTLRNDFTIAHNKQLYQIEDAPPVTRTKTVVVEERIDGTIRITYKNAQLKYKKIEIKPLKTKEHKSIEPRKIYIPPPDHPWRRFKINPYSRYQQREKISLS